MARSPPGSTPAQLAEGEGQVGRGNCKRVALCSRSRGRTMPSNRRRGEQADQAAAPSQPIPIGAFTLCSHFQQDTSAT